MKVDVSKGTIHDIETYREELLRKIGYRPLTVNIENYTRSDNNIVIDDLSPSQILYGGTLPQIKLLEIHVPYNCETPEVLRIKPSVFRQNPGIWVSEGHFCFFIKLNDNAKGQLQSKLDWIEYTVNNVNITSDENNRGIKNLIKYETNHLSGIVQAENIINGLNIPIKKPVIKETASIPATRPLRAVKQASNSVNLHVHGDIYNSPINCVGGDFNGDICTKQGFNLEEVLTFLQEIKEELQSSGDSRLESEILPILKKIEQGMISSKPENNIIKNGLTEIYSIAKNSMTTAVGAFIYAKACLLLGISPT